MAYSPLTFIAALIAWCWLICDACHSTDTQHKFNRHKSDWGYTYFIPLGELFDPGRGYLLDDTIIVKTDIAVPSRDSKESGCQEESQHPSQDNNTGNVEVDITAISGEEVSSVESVWQGLVLTEAPSVDKEAERVHSESALYTSFSGTSPPQQATQPISGTQGSSEATPVGATSTITQAGGHASGQASDNARGCNIGKVRFLSYWVSSEASLLLERIHGLHKDSLTKFSMKGHILQTTLLESFASFIESMSNTTVHDEEALHLAAISIEDFEQVGLDLSWLKHRLDEGKRVNKHTESLTFVDLCESALKVAQAKDVVNGVLSCFRSIDSSDSWIKIMYDSRNSTLERSILLIDNSNHSGSMDFVVPPVDASVFFPISVRFTAASTFSELKVLYVLPLRGGPSPRFAQRTLLSTENYQVV
ncbi:hypothetical protein ACSBR2_007116 [Camellia fascicularis]